MFKGFATITTSDSNTFSPLQKKFPCHFSRHSPDNHRIPSCLWSYLFWMFRVNEIRHHTIFHSWLLFFTLHSVYKVNLCCTIYQYFLLLKAKYYSVLWIDHSLNIGLSKRSLMDICVDSIWEFYNWCCYESFFFHWVILYCWIITALYIFRTYGYVIGKHVFLFCGTSGSCFFHCFANLAGEVWFCVRVFSETSPSIFSSILSLLGSQHER